jgi:putative colanic acid biosynthesis acetyltransferase WcaF
MRYQRLDLFRLPKRFRGKSAAAVQFWWLIQATVFKWSPQIAYGFRRWLLRCFGATIGTGVIIRPSVTITYPWQIEIGDYSWIGDDVTLYSLGNIIIGSHSVVSQKSYICAADHDYRDVQFGIRSRPINIADQVWIGCDVFIGPGCRVGQGTVIGARSSVFKDMPAGMICYGYPCVVVKSRDRENSEVMR